MIKLAATAHCEQFDKQGQPYFLHCITVMQLLNSDDEELNCIALGHDLFEDTDVTYEEVYEIFGPRVANGILALTKMHGISYDSYIERVCGNIDAIKVKMCDLRHNSDITRQRDALSDKAAARILKYHRTYIKLEKELKNV